MTIDPSLAGLTFGAEDNGRYLIEVSAQYFAM
jgi:hypothetical protein